MAINDKDEFAAAFNEGEGAAPAPGGMEMPAGEEPGAGTADEGGEPATTDAATQTEEASDPAAGMDLPAEGGEAAAAAGDAPDVVVAIAPGKDGSEDLEKERQRLRSWEGRLKKAQADLEAKGGQLDGDDPEGSDLTESDADTVADALDDVSTAAETKGDAALADEAGQLAGQVDRGEITPDDAMTRLAEDFGEPFVRMIESIARKVAAEEGGRVATERLSAQEERTQAIIDHIQDRETRAHFDAIAAKHPDFAQINEDPAFKDWIAQDAQRGETQASGSASEINAMLDEFKASTSAAAGEPETAEPPAAAPAQDTPSDDDVDAAEGVAASGMTLPKEPAGQNDFEAAWREA